MELLSEKLTIVVIAHRLSTIQNADNIIVIENGEIVEVFSATGKCNKMQSKSVTPLSG